MVKYGIISLLIIAGLAVFAVPVCTPTVLGGGEKVEDLSVPEGFEIRYFAKDVANARSMAKDENGIIYVGTRSEGNVYAIVDENQDYLADTVYTLAEDLNMPNGVAVRDGDLYVAEVSKIWRYENIAEQLNSPPEPVLVFDSLPDDRSHGWKYIAFGPDGKLYVPIGAPGNIVLREDDQRYSSIMRMNSDGSDAEIYVRGVRNTVGFDWHPESGNLFFTDNGRDWMGDNLPPDELNKVTEKGQHFGYPFCHGGDIPDPKFGDQRACEEFMPPYAKLGPHVAALGMEFYNSDQFPKKYRDRIYICEHGSWNRSTPIGYRVMMVYKDENDETIYEPFINGWLDGSRAWGRPVDILELDDGSFLISDDHADAIYRISYVGK